MSINLTKGQRISLEKEAPGLTKLMCGLGWDIAQPPPGKVKRFFTYVPDYDLDAAVVCLDQVNHVRGNGDLIYFGNLQHQSGAITHLGDNLTGAGEGDDEEIIVNLTQIPDYIQKLVFTVNIYSCLTRKQDFSQVNNAFVRLVDLANRREIARYDLSGDEYHNMTGMVMAEIYRQDQDWKMAAIGDGFRVSNLEELVTLFT